MLPRAVAEHRKETTMDAKALADITAALEAERDRLAHEVSDLERDSAQMQSDTSGENNYRDHMGDQGTATFGKELDMTLEDNARDLYKEVLTALERVEAGTFGACVSCGAQIAPERLLAMPAAALCITCKEREESH
jgi:RNA polymerase-binding protein DksA